MQNFLYEVFMRTWHADGKQWEVLYTRDAKGQVYKTDEMEIGIWAGPFSRYKPALETWGWVTENAEFIGNYYLS